MSEMHIQQLPSMKPVSLAGAAIADAGKTCIGGCAPSLPPVRISAIDAGKGRSGGCAPSLPRVSLAPRDAGSRSPAARAHLRQ
ncbi:MAG: hypothetical protein ACK42J_00195 [Alphaproteobacteria bacterium]